MMRFVLHTAVGDVSVSLDALVADVAARLAYEGPKAAVAMVRHDVERSAGAFGHLIGEETTPRDLLVAMHAAPLVDYTPRLLEGVAIPELPARLR